MPRKRSAAGRYAFIGLIIAGLGCVATGLLALVQGTVALKLFTPASASSIPQWLALTVGIFILGLATYSILNPSGVRHFLTGRQARYGSNALVMSLAFLGILFIINLLVYQNPKSWDFTEGQQHSLAPQTVQALATLPEKVAAIGFFTAQTQAETARQLLSDFKSKSNGKFDFRFVDPNANPVLARQYGITGDGKIVLTMGKASETATYADETALTQAMIRLISPQARVVYFLTGHGEPDINGTDNTSLSRARATLESKNYTVKTLNLASVNKIPEDARAIVEAGPTSPLLDAELSVLQHYVSNKGSLIIMEDPSVLTDFGAGPDPLSDYLGRSWGITFNDDVVLDNRTSQLEFAVGIPGTTTQPITAHQSTNAMMPWSRSLTVSQQPPNGVAITPLIVTSAQTSYAETDLAGLKNKQQPNFEPATDRPGPATLAAAGENSATESRVVAFGSSTFATNQLFDTPFYNSDLFVNSVDWAAQQGNLINITPRTPIARTFNAPPQVQFIAILLGSVIVIPGLIVFAGVSSWLARRRQD